MPVETLPRSPHGGGECMDRHDEWSGSNVAETPTSVAVVDMRARSTVSDVSNGGDDGEDWDSGYQREIIDGVTAFTMVIIYVLRMIRRSRIGRSWRMSLVEY